MRRLPELDSMRPDLEKWIVGMADRMGESAICLSIFTDDYKKGIDSLLQFAVAVMLDKPIFLLVQEGTTIPERVKRVADGIEFYKRDADGSSLKEASTRLLRQATEKGFTE